ncbi:MAG: hypothetical protein HC789_04625 [Microcoleus sp. CSU_2_2]|nr:hypothetical protein [Microcoleus sp. CSU_2_2]
MATHPTLLGMVRRCEIFKLIWRESMATHPTLFGMVRRCEIFKLIWRGVGAIALLNFLLILVAIQMSYGLWVWFP